MPDTFRGKPSSCSRTRTGRKNRTNAGRGAVNGHAVETINIAVGTIMAVVASMLYRGPTPKTDPDNTAYVHYQDPPPAAIGHEAGRATRAKTASCRQC